jgi:hypothetical protein
MAAPHPKLKAAFPSIPLLLVLALASCEPAPTTLEAERAVPREDGELSYLGHRIPRKLSLDVGGGSYRTETSPEGGVRVYAQSLRALGECASLEPGLLPESCQCVAGFWIVDMDGDGKAESCEPSLSTTCLTAEVGRLLPWQDLGLCQDKNKTLQDTVAKISELYAQAKPTGADGSVSEAPERLDLEAMCARIERSAKLKEWRDAALKSHLGAEAEATREEALKGENTEIPEDTQARVQRVRGCDAQTVFGANMVDQKGEFLHHLECALELRFSPLAAEWVQLGEADCNTRGAAPTASTPRARKHSSSEPATSTSQRDTSVKGKAKSGFQKATTSVKKFFRGL